MHGDMVIRYSSDRPIYFRKYLVDIKLFHQYRITKFNFQKNNLQQLVALILTSLIIKKLFIIYGFNLGGNVLLFRWNF